MAATYDTIWFGLYPYSTKGRRSLYYFGVYRENIYELIYTDYKAAKEGGLKGGLLLFLTIFTSIILQSLTEKQP